jgi:hypothetical protein
VIRRAALALVLACGAAAAAASVTIKQQGVLYTGGVASGDGMSGQMHVFYQIPARVHARWPARLGDLVPRAWLASLCRRSAGQGRFRLFPASLWPAGA